MDLYHPVFSLLWENFFMEKFYYHKQQGKGRRIKILRNLKGVW